MLEYAYFGVRGAPRGTRGDFSFAVQELELLPGDQVRSKREVPVLVRDLPLLPGTPAVASNGGSTADGTTSTPSTSSEHAATADPCASIANCYVAGPFTVQLTSVVVSKAANERYLRVAARFRNLTGERLILCFTSASGVADDERQNRYRIRESNGLVKGIGLCNGQTANPDFVLAPSGQRDASLEFFTGIYQGTILGDVFAISFALEQLNILPGNQIQRVGQYVASFEGVTARGGNAVLNATGSNEVQKARGFLDRLKKAATKP